ncbi:MAG TPA: sigma-70 family RNA polymerase sigma factor [Candidatus Limnocylindrales bacterium]
MGAGPDIDADLCRRLALGEVRAFTEVYSAYAPSVFRVANGIVRDAAEAEDITQEVFVLLWQRPDRFDPSRGSLSGWLHTVAHNRAVAHVRRVATAERCLRMLGAALPSAPDGAQPVLSKITVALVHTAVCGLPEPLRTALVLAYFEGLSYREVGRRLGIAEGTAKSRLRLALRLLRGALHAGGW